MWEFYTMWDAQKNQAEERQLLEGQGRGLPGELLWLAEVEPHLSRGRLCSYVGVGGLLLVDSGGGVPLVEPQSTGQVRDPGRTTATVACNWLEILWGLCERWVDQLGWGHLACVPLAFPASPPPVSNEAQSPCLVLGTVLLHGRLAGAQQGCGCRPPA
jgi:hypothetical protein